MPLRSSFFERPSPEVARALIGKLLVHESPGEPRLVGRIVETEAYGHDDPACHGWGVVDRETGQPAEDRRGYALFGAPGSGYVYLIYGIHWLLNVVTEPEGICGAVLLRGVEPVEGLEAMRARRSVARTRDLTNGPGKLAQAFDVDQRFHQMPLTRPPLYFEEERHLGAATERSEPARGEASASEAPRIITSPRIGISAATERPWRFYVEGNRFVSRGG